MVKSVLAFKDVGLSAKPTLAGSGSEKSSFLRPGSKYDDPSNLSSHLDDRNMMEKSIMHFGHFWVSTSI